MRVKFLVTPVGLMMGNIESARRLKDALTREGVSVVDDPKAREFDLLHVHTPVPPTNLMTVRKAKSQGKPVVMHAHTTAEDSEGTWTGSEALSGVTGKYLTQFYNHGDIVLAPSSWTKGRLEARGVRARIRVLSNGVDLNRFAQDDAKRRSFRAKYGIPEHERVVYCVGVVCLKKGIEVFPSVTSRLPDTRFIWVGRRSGLYHPIRVRRAMRACAENVRFIHDLADIAEAHCGCDCFFTPSFTENQGMAVMEAMAVGRPVVARNLPVYEGLLKDEESALLGSTADDFASAIERLGSDTGLARRLTDGAGQTIQGHDLAKIARELAGIYESLLEDDGRATG